MRIDGKLIAQKILENLKKTIKQFRLHPTLAVILVGENPASISYIRQKQKAAEFIGAKIKNFNLPENISEEKLVKLIGELNHNPRIQGIIAQLPFPPHLNPQTIQLAINPKKDVDGFTPNSPFTPPVAGAVLKILASIPGINVSKRITVIGRGLTAGKPIAKTLKKLGYKVTVTHSQTISAQFAKLVKSADVVISCVGKPDIIKAGMLKPGAIVIGVGIYREPDHLRGEKPDESRVGAPRRRRGVDTSKVKLVGDFNEEEIGRVASFYTPTPGGVGPANVACLMENLVKAALNQTQTSS